MKWLAAWRERRTWKLLIRQLEALSERNRKAHARQIQREAAGLMAAGPVSEKQQAINRAVKENWQRVIEQSRRFAADCTAIGEMTPDPGPELNRIEAEVLRKQSGLGNADWDQMIDRLKQDREAAVDALDRLERLRLARNVVLSDVEQRQIDRAIRDLKRAFKGYNAEVRKRERERRRAEDAKVLPIEAYHSERKSVSHPGRIKSLRLEPFSAAFAKRIAARHPEWATYLKPDEQTSDGLTVFTLRIDFPSENSAVPEPLSIFVDLDRIIGWQWFPMPSGGCWNLDNVYYFQPPKKDYRTDFSGFDFVIDWIESFLAEEIVAFVSTGPDRRVSGALKASELSSSPKTSGEDTTFRSWLGTLDRNTRNE